MLDNIRIVLVQTYHPGNIGSAARAMKNMGLKNLWLVNPVDFPSEQATAMAANAEDILESAQIVSSLADAIEDCGMVVGTSARERSFNLPSLLPGQCASQMISETRKYPVALVFGRERMGLHNDEIQQCHFQVNIPANPEYPVLNIAQAIQILSYELFQHSREVRHTSYEEAEYPLHREIEHFYDHLEQVLLQLEVIRKNHPGNTMERFRRLFRRARLEKHEISLLRGVLRNIQSRLTD
ncbi:tRNA (cytosine(32)/uridine(32)-2'-O)-methyltransferase TrmJ [Gynuella sunshinyii]|uniref:tRNA (cytidine/uridine-2'-O-)-methyltransferase TrmJ n=1 Tax=Gynuella sunshinyii YC6258 TaxID=1445510 RepID=A0A0C5V793_9GAMM|nr:tRNA (cytosine(32)/uridine(32)-2'-O)-methyltransferase TrmJ [Gynuella sunshinyii]AJQ95265.1 rRNA methylase [Gynuella sunshinyii YC6258]